MTSGTAGSGQRLVVLGAGRLGRALALRLRERYEVAVADREPRLAKQFGKLHRLRSLAPAEVAGFAEVAVVACVPGEEMVAALRPLAIAGTAALCVSTATSLPTGRLTEHPELRGLRIAGLKPVGQFVAIARGVPVVFVTGSAAEHRLLREVFAGLGEVVLGDEDSVAELNRIATGHALRACDALRTELGRLTGDDRLVGSAVRGVFGGTALDYPPDPANGYVRAIRAGLAGIPGGAL